MPVPIPAIMAGVGGLLNLFGSKKRAEDQNANRQNDLISRVFLQKQFSPFEPFSTLGKGKLISALARSMGFDKILGEQYLNFISDAGNVPGTQGIGGAADLPLPQFKKTTSGNTLSLIGSALSGISPAFSGFGGGGRGIEPIPPNSGPGFFGPNP